MQYPWSIHFDEMKVSTEKTFYNTPTNMVVFWAKSDKTITLPLLVLGFIYRRSPPDHRALGEFREDTIMSLFYRPAHGIPDTANFHNPAVTAEMIVEFEAHYYHREEEWIQFYRRGWLVL